MRRDGLNSATRYLKGAWIAIAAGSAIRSERHIILLGWPVATQPRGFEHFRKTAVKLRFRKARPFAH